MPFGRNIIWDGLTIRQQLRLDKKEKNIRKMPYKCCKSCTSWSSFFRECMAIVDTTKCWFKPSKRKEYD